MLTFVKEVYSELQKVTFPTRREVIRLTSAVIIISVIVGAYIGASDLLFTKVMELVIK